jgi:hypothetical protein
MTSVSYACSGGCGESGPYGETCENCDDFSRFTVTAVSWHDRHARVLQPIKLDPISLIEHDEQMRLAQEKPEPPFVAPPTLPPIGSTNQVLNARACAKCNQIFEGSPETHPTIPMHYRNTRFGTTQCVGQHKKPLPYYRTRTEPDRPDTNPVPKASRTELARAYLLLYHWVQTTSELTPREHAGLMGGLNKDSPASRHAAMLFSNTLPEGKPWATTQELASALPWEWPSVGQSVQPQCHRLRQYLEQVIPAVVAECDRQWNNHTAIQAYHAKYENWR